jgi:hypothetical protein
MRRICLAQAVSKKIENSTKQLRYRRSPEVADRTRVRTQLDPPCRCGGQDDACKEVPGQLVVARSDPSIVLQAGEHALDQVSLPVSLSIVGNEWFSARNRGDDSLDAALPQQAAQPIGVVGFVGDKALYAAGSSEQLRRHHNIMDIARSDQKDAGFSRFIGQRMDRRCPAAA